MAIHAAQYDVILDPPPSYITRSKLAVDVFAIAVTV
jgi:hypothetical protein